MPGKVLFCDLNKKAYVPEECLYAASRIGRIVGFENLDIVRVSDEADLAVLDRVLRGYGGDHVTVFCWLYDTFVPSHIIELALPLFRRLSAMDNVTLAVSGWQPTLASELMRSSGLFDYVVAGWPWLIDFSWLDAPRPEEPVLIRQSEAGGYPDDVRYSDAFNRIVNLDKCIFRSDSGETCFTYPFEKGCQNSCKFCFSNGFKGDFGGNIRKSPERIAEELDFLRHRLGTNRVLVTDFKLRAENVRVLLDNGFSIAEQVDLCVSDLDPGLIDLLRRADLDTGFVGIESLVPRVQKDIGKYYNLRRFSENLAYGAARGVMFEGGIVLGLGATAEQPLTREDVLAQVSEAMDFYRLQPNLRILFYPLIPLIGTPLGDALWADPARRPASMESYFDLVARIIEVREIPPHLPLPPCYADMEAYELIRRVSHASMTLVRHKTSMFRHLPSVPEKARVCEHLSELMYDLMGKGYHDFGPHIEGILKSLATWRSK